MFRVIRATDHPEYYRRFAASPAFALDRHPFSGGFGQSYFPLVFDTARTETSFAVADGETPLALVPCTIGTSGLDYYSHPVTLFTPGNQLLAEPAGRAVMDALRQVAGRHEVTIAGAHIFGSAAGIDAFCAAAGLTSKARFTALCDVTRGEESVRPGLRKSFRSLVNWGKKNLRLTYVNAANPDRDAFASYQAFHLRVAGRSTRAQATWDAMFDWIAQGRGEVSLGYLEDGALVSGTMVVDGDTAAYYASGVYDRDRFDKPIGHWPLYDAMLRSALRGVKWFELGDIPQEGTVDTKEYNIGYFKRGFATEMIEWKTWNGRLG